MNRRSAYPALTFPHSDYLHPALASFAPRQYGKQKAQAPLLTARAGCWTVQQRSAKIGLPREQCAPDAKKPPHGRLAHGVSLTGDRFYSGAGFYTHDAHLGGLYVLRLVLAPDGSHRDTVLARLAVRHDLHQLRPYFNHHAQLYRGRF